jgi:hypothetical protein
VCAKGQALKQLVQMLFEEAGQDLYPSPSLPEHEAGINKPLILVRLRLPSHSYI